MKAALWINRVLLTLLSLSTAGVKFAQMEAEMVIFRNVGFSDTMTIAFGAVQFIGGVLLIPPQTTKLGAWIMLPTFAFATYVLLANGQIPFGISSLLFIAMALFHALKWGSAARAA